ncbi:MAG: TIGR03905 family TSCPD domain-containing protein [Oscillospiraceae bacterium]|nr:TIGR03905 family TSCPD domain-containing protein [Oscillospiraceae bacterium]
MMYNNIKDRGASAIEHQYKAKGICPRGITVELDDGVVRRVEFKGGGCDGNLAGLAGLAVGMRAEEVISRLRGLRCGFKQTSCPDQLSHALTEALALEKRTG